MKWISRRSDSGFFNGFANGFEPGEMDDGIKGTIAGGSR